MGLFWEFLVDVFVLSHSSGIISGADASRRTRRKGSVVSGAVLGPDFGDYSYHVSFDGVRNLQCPCAGIIVNNGGKALKTTQNHIDSLWGK
mmetsp:Transcript_19905/g.46251  ORF Transcript_19905/g.46251 Transcript_19905/m.46251 type:complete len:91 (-) Transcript_19905:802-1074(-)